MAAAAVEGIQGPASPQPVFGAGDADLAYGSLANFVIEKKIGRGQFSTVYRARCQHDGSMVALKKVQVCWMSR